MPRKHNKENNLKKKPPKKSKQFEHTSYEDPNPKITQLIQIHPIYYWHNPETMMMPRALIQKANQRMNKTRKASNLCINLLLKTLETQN